MQWRQELRCESLHEIRYAQNVPSDHLPLKYQVTISRRRDDGSTDLGHGYVFLYFFAGRNLVENPDHFKVQMQYTERFSGEREELTKVHEFLGVNWNGAWQHSLEWRHTSATGKASYIYAQSAEDHWGRNRGARGTNPNILPHWQVCPFAFSAPIAPMQYGAGNSGFGFKPDFERSVQAAGDDFPAMNPSAWLTDNSARAWADHWRGGRKFLSSAKRDSQHF